MAACRQAKRSPRRANVRVSKRHVAQSSFDRWRRACGLDSRVARLSLERRRLGVTVRNQRFLSWAFCWSREHGQGKVQRTLGFPPHARSPPRASFCHRRVAR
jgi:hypothetical protein